MSHNCAAILELIGGFFTALCGAGFGALAAYLFAKRDREEQRRAEQHGESIGAMYAMLARVTAIENFCRKFLNEPRDAIQGRFRFHVLYQSCPTERISLTKLGFMADGVDGQLLYDLSVSEAQYFDFVEAISERNRDARVLIDAAQRIGIRAGEPIGVHARDLPELDLVLNQNRNVVNAANWALTSVTQEVERLEVSIATRFPEFRPVRATPTVNQLPNRVPGSD